MIKNLAKKDLHIRKSQIIIIDVHSTAIYNFPQKYYNLHNHKKKVDLYINISYKK